MTPTPDTPGAKRGRGRPRIGVRRVLRTREDQDAAIAAIAAPLGGRRHEPAVIRALIDEALTHRENTMKIGIYLGDLPDWTGPKAIDADWPAVPRIGETVEGQATEAHWFSGTVATVTWNVGSGTAFITLAESDG